MIGLLLKEKNLQKKTLEYKFRDKALSLEYSDSHHFSNEYIYLISRNKRGSNNDYTKGKVAVFLDGYISNYRDMQKDLGYCNMETNHTASDEEIISYSYEKWGAGFAKRIEGNFVIFIWDDRLKKMFLYRDHVGIKPIFFAKRKEYLIFGSNIPDMLNFESSQIKLRQDRVFEYLTFRFVSGAETLFADVHQLLPGYFLVCDIDNSIQLNQYWDINNTDTRQKIKRLPDYIYQLSSTIDENVRLRVNKYRDLGIMLSGGLDSTFLLAIAQKYKESIKTFTMGFKDNENPDIKAVENIKSFYKIKPHYIIVNNNEFSDHLPYAIKNFTFPIDHPNFVIRDILFKTAKEANVHNLIAGEGADTIFGGAWYVSLKKYLLCKKLFRFNFVRFLPFLLRNRKIAVLNKVLDSSIEDLIVLDKTYTNYHNAMRVIGINNPDLSKKFQYIYNELNNAYRLSPMEKAFYLGLKTALAVYPRDQVIMSSANDINLEYPFLDRNVVEYVLSIPPSIKIKYFNAKYLFKKIAEQHLRKEIINRSKHGLPVPLAEWFKDKNGLGRYLRMLQDDKTQRRDTYNYPEIKAVVKSFHEGDDKMAEILWVLVNLELWQRIFIDGNYFN